MTGPARVAVVACVALLVAGGCRSEPERSPASPPRSTDAERSALPPVSLPDLSRMEPSVQQQLNDSYLRLLSKTGTPATPSADLARAYGETASLLLAANAADAAEPFYLHAQALEPGERRWPYYLGHVYMARADAANAIAAFERARQLRPDDVATLVWLGGVYLDQGQPELAEPLFMQARTAQPRAVSVLVGLGQASLARRDYVRAVDWFEQALAADPRASIVHYPLAQAYRGLGDMVRAEAHLRQRGDVKVGPPDPLMAELRGLLHGAAAEDERGTRALTGGDFAAAVRSFQAAVDLAPGDPSLRHKLGTALSLTGDTPGAMRQFQEALRQSPDFAPAHYSLGVLFAAAGRDREAVDHFSAAVRAEPGYAEARQQLAEARARLKSAPARR